MRKEEKKEGGQTTRVCKHLPWRRKEVLYEAGGGAVSEQPWMAGTEMQPFWSRQGLRLGGDTPRAVFSRS